MNLQDILDAPNSIEELKAARLAEYRELQALLDRAAVLKVRQAAYDELVLSFYNMQSGIKHGYLTNYGIEKDKERMSVQLTILNTLGSK